MQIVESRRQANERVGVIAFSCARSVYAYLADCGMPTVVLGSLYPDLRQSLPSVDLDYYEAGRAAGAAAWSGGDTSGLAC